MKNKMTKRRHKVNFKLIYNFFQYSEFINSLKDYFITLEDWKNFFEIDITPSTLNEIKIHNIPYVFKSDEVNVMPNGSLYQDIRDAVNDRKSDNAKSPKELSEKIKREKENNE